MIHSSRWLFGSYCLYLFVIFACPQPTWAQQDKSPAIAKFTGASSFKLLGASQALDEVWLSATARLDAGDFVTGIQRLEGVVSRRSEIGAPNCFMMSDVLLHFAIQAAESDDPNSARSLVNIARTLASDSPHVALTSAMVLLKGEASGWGHAIHDLIDGLKGTWGYLPGRVLLTTRLAVVGLIWLYSVLIFFGFFMVVRHGGRLIHDIGHLFPRAMRGLPILIISGVAFVAGPLSLGGGLVLMGLGWFVFLSPYFSMRERIVAIVLSAGMMVTPTLNVHYSTGMAFPGSQHDAVYTCTHGRCSPSLYDKLGPLDDTAPLSLERSLAVGLTRKRRAAGETSDLYVLYDALNTLKAAVDQAPSNYPAALNYALLVHLREVYECKKERRTPKLSEVEQLYQAALELNPDGAEVHYNLSVLYAQQGKAVESAKFLELASGLDFERVKRAQKEVQGDIKVACPLRFNGNKRLMEALPSVSGLAASIRGDVNSDAPALVPFRNLLVGNLEVGLSARLGLLVAVIVLLSGFMGMFFRPAHRCHICNSVACGRCRNELKQLEYCERCLFTAIQGKFVDSRQKWLHDRKIESRKARASSLNRMTSFLAPGSAQLVRGSTLSGILYASLCVFAVLMALAGPWLASDVSSTQTSIAVSLVVGFVGILVYIVALIDSWVGR